MATDKDDILPAGNDAAEDVTEDLTEDDEAKIWADLAAKESEAPDSDDEPVHTVSVPDDDQPDTKDQPGDGVEDVKPVRETVDTGDKPKPDPWADAPDNLRTDFESLRTENEALKKSESRAAGRVVGQTRKVTELMSENARLRENQQKLSKVTEVSDQEDPELVSAREEFPEVVGPLERSNQQLRDEITQVRSAVDTRFAKIDERDMENYLDQQDRLLTDSHPDWKTIVNSDEFTTWAGSQPAMVTQAIDASADAQEMSLVFSLYKQTSEYVAPKTNTGKDNADDPSNDDAATKRAAQLASSTTPKAKAPPQITPGMPEDDEGIWNMYREQDRREAARKQ